MRIAVLADVHGNLPALEAVLDDVDAIGVDMIVLNGDLADGPMPAQTLDRLEQIGNQALWVRGNTDRCSSTHSMARSDRPVLRAIPHPSTSPGAQPRSHESIAIGLPICH